MKKIRHILLFIVAVAMMVSMSAMCFSVSAETGSAATTDTEWSLGENAFEIGAAGSTALLEKGPFKLDLVGKTLSATVVDVGGVASIQTTEGKTAFAKSASGIIDLAPAAGEARVVFTAPADGTYAFSASLEKTSMPTYATGSIVKNWSQIGATETAGGGFKGGWGYAGKGIGNDSGWASGVNAVLSQSSVVELTAGQCITVSVAKEGDSDNTHTTLKMFNVYKIEDIKDGSAWSLGDEFKIGAENSTALLSNGLFGIDLKGKTLDSTVVKNGGVESILSTDGKRAFTKSASGIIDVTPAAGTCAQVYFKAPVDGTYWFAVAAEKTDMSGVPEGKVVKNWTEIGPKASLASAYNTTTGFASGVNYTGAAIGNTTGFTLKNVYFSGKATLTAGQVITMTINAEGDTDETQTTLKGFDVLLLPSTATSDAFASTIGTPDALGTANKNNFALGSITPASATIEGTSFRPVIADELSEAWTGSGASGYYAWAVLHNETKYSVFGTTQTGSIMDMMPKYALPSVITYTAPSDGVYFYDAMFKRSSGSSDKSIAMIVGTGNASGAYVGELEKTEIAVNETLLVNGTVELKAGDTIWFVADNYEAAVSAEVGVKKLEVTRLGDHVCREWNNDGNCTTKATCKFCGEKTGEINANVHASNETYFVNNGENHTEKRSCCNTDVATGNHDWSNKDGECTKCDAVCTHTGEYTYTDNGNGTHTKANKCCGLVVTATEAHDWTANDGKCKACESVCAHTGEYTYADNGDGTHTKTNKCCGLVVTATEAHDWSNKDGECAKCGFDCAHTNATVANCQVGSTCETCKKALSDKDATNHVNNATNKLPNEDGETHTEKWLCCGVEVANDQTHVFGDDVVCDECGYGCDHESWDAEYKCENCGYACPHVESTDATCVAEATCKECGKKTADKNAENHASTETEFVDNGNGTHTEKHACCGVDIDTNNHDWTNKDGECAKCDATCAHANAPEADCKNASVCPTCGKTVAEKDPAKHVANTTVLVDNENGTHTEKYECCGAVVKADAQHDFTNGNCACGAKKPASKPSSPNTADTGLSVAVALVAIAGVGIFALNSKKRRQK